MLEKFSDIINWVVILAVPVLLFFVVHAIFRSQTDNRKKHFVAFADKVGAKMMKSKNVGVLLPRAEMIYHNYPMQISYGPGRGKSNDLYSTFELSVPEAAEFRFSMSAKNLMRYASEGQRVVTGDTSFDDQLLVKSNDPARLREILTDNIRIPLTRAAWGLPPLYMHLINGKLSFVIEGTFERELFGNSFIGMMNVAVAMADGIKRLQKDGIPSIPSAPLATGEKTPVFNASHWESLGKAFQNARFVDEGDISTCYGSVGKRNVVMHYNYLTHPQTLIIELSVIQKFWLRMIAQSTQEQSEEITVNDPWLDSHYRIHSDQPEAAVRFLSSVEARATFPDLFAFYRFEIRKARAILSLADPAQNGLQAERLKQTLARLSDLLDIYERQKLDMGVAAGISSSSICPFCRERLNPSKDSIVTCTNCRTPHHQDCWLENNECTTWGCFSTTST
ncbi:MAG: hypothetical protein C5B54_03190, partial [Acidobacteria bacterium]